MSKKKSNIYTKGGDKGITSLPGGRRVPKYDNKIEAYGTMDELIAHTALLRDMTEDEKIREDLLLILEKLLSAASLVAIDNDDLPENLPALTESDVKSLEVFIDVMDNELPILKSFIIPGGHISSSQAHVARTVCRRAERIILKLDKNEPVNEVIIKYFNRLSDYYFLLSRKLAAIYKQKEIPWKL